MTLKEDEVRDEIGHIFNRAYGRLLIVGLPGSGKTTLVIQLALHILGLEHKSMPVVLNLATWRAKFKTFDEWLSEILPTELGTSQKLAEQIRHNTPLILLLDGLDEVPEADRASCLTAIGEYGANPKHQFLISSRIAEYSATKDAPVNAQIEVAPLTIDQIEFGLTASVFLQPESKRLLNALKSDPLLRQAVENPFYLNTAQLLFASGKNWSEFGFAATNVVGRQRELVKQFVERALTRSDEYTDNKARHWLSFLASRMTTHSMVVLELRDLKYEWWKWSKGHLILANIPPHILNIFKFTLGMWLFGGLLGAVLYGQPYRLVNGLSIGLLYGLALALVLGPIFGLIGGLSGEPPRITTSNRIDWSWKNIMFYIGKNLDTGLAIGLISGMVGGMRNGIIFGLVVGLFGGLCNGLLDILTKDRKEWVREIIIFYIRKNLIFGLLGGLFFGSVVGGLSNMIAGPIHGLVFGLVYGLAMGLSELMRNGNDIIQINTPYQRFHISSQALHFSIIKHKMLCYQLRKQGLLPPDLVKFLNEMSHRHILETDGATWRFRHRILQDYFDGLWVEPKGNVKTREVGLYIDRDLSTYTELDQEELLRVIKILLKIYGNINIKGIEEGGPAGNLFWGAKRSVLLTLELTRVQCDKLHWEANTGRFERFDVMCARYRTD